MKSEGGGVRKRSGIALVFYYEKNAAKVHRFGQSPLVLRSTCLGQDNPHYSPLAQPSLNHLVYSFALKKIAPLSLWHCFFQRKRTNSNSTRHNIAWCPYNLEHESMTYSFVLNYDGNDRKLSTPVSEKLNMSAAARKSVFEQTFHGLKDFKIK